MSDSWLDEVEVPTVATSSATVKDIADSVQILGLLLKEQEDREAEMKTLNEKIRKLQENTIPDMLKAQGITALTVPGVGEVSYKVEYKASIPADKWSGFKAWAQDAGYGDVCKELATVTNPDSTALTALRNSGIDFDLAPAMHWQTLSKIARELAAAGKTFPAELSVFSYNKTIVKQKK